MPLLSVTIKTFTELNLYTESGLAKLAVGVRLEGANIQDSQRTYRYTAFNRGNPEVPTFNEDFIFNVDWADEDQVYVKFRIVEEGPTAIHTAPYDSRSPSPVLEIIPDCVKRTIIAYGRIPFPKKEVHDLFRRVQLHEVNSDDICGELAVGLHWINEEYASEEQIAHNLPASNLLAVANEMRGSYSSMGAQNNDGAVVLTLQNSQDNNDSIAAEAVSSEAMKEIAQGNLAETSIGTDDMKSHVRLYVPQPPHEVLENDDSRPASIASSGRSSMAEEADFEDEEKMTFEMLQHAASPIQNFNDNDIIGVLSVEIVAALNLLQPKRFFRNPDRQANPFCTISFGKRSFRTKVKTNTSSPIWKERLAFTLKATEMSYKLILSVYDYENLGRNSCISTAQLRINHFIQNPEQVLRVAVPLNPTKQVNDNTQESNLLLKVNFMPFERVRKNFWTKLLMAFDLNNNGRICKVELETMLESLGSTLSEATIERLFAALNCAEGDEIEIDEAVKFLEDLSILTHNHRHQNDNEENIVLLRSCPFCLKKWNDKMDDLDVITHLGICSASETSNISLSDKFVMGGFLTEEYASRKWFSRLLGFMSFGNYKIGRNNANIFVQDRCTGKLIEEKIPTYIRLGIRLLHQNVVTYRTSADFSYIRNIFQSMTIQQGKKYEDPSSVASIPGFIKYHKLPVHEILDPLDSFKSFNEFFYRRIKLDEYRPLSHPDDPCVTVSPADCRLHVFPTISEATRLWIKGVNFSVSALLADEELGRYFEGGSLVIARLAPQDYHRFHSPVDGTVTANYHIPGTYFTVNPMAVRQKVDVYTENARTVTMIDSPQFGKVAFVSIGAMMVGSIEITVDVGSKLRRRDEVGYFAFGGSTIVLLYSKEAKVQFDSDLVENSQQQLETLIKVGDSIGRTPNVII